MHPLGDTISDDTDLPNKKGKKMTKKRIAISLLLTFITVGQSHNLYAEPKSNQAEQDGVKVLTTPWPKKEFTDGPDIILIKGSWIGTSGGNFVYDGKPTINTVDIICEKAADRCIEARAEISPLAFPTLPGNLMVRSWEYKIVKWTEQEVEAIETSEPFNLLGHSVGKGKGTLRIDRIHEITTLSGKYNFDGKNGTWEAHIDSGDKLMEIYKSK